MKTSYIYRDDSGFTLVEILIATFILTVGILGVTGMFITAIKANQLGRSNTVGTRLAQNLMEQAKTQTSTVFGTFTSGTGISSAINTVTVGTAPNIISRTRGGIFRQSLSGNLNMINYSAILQQNVNFKNNSAFTGLDTWTVRVKWIDTYGRHETKLITYIDN